MVVVGVVVHSLVHHCHMAIDLLSPFLQWPVLSTFPPAALVCPAVQRQMYSMKYTSMKVQITTNCHDSTIITLLQNIYKTVHCPFFLQKKRLKLPGCHDDNKHILFPDHSPEITVCPFQWSCTVHSTFMFKFSSNLL